MEHDKTECQPPPEAPILFINNCGFFESVATINMCSKCYKDMLMKQERAKLAASTFDGIVNGLSSSNTKDSNFAVGIVDLLVNNVEPKTVTTQPSKACRLGQNVETKPREGPNRCNTYKRRVSLTGLKCRCGNLFCPPHGYSDKQDCPFDRTSG